VSALLDAGAPAMRHVARLVHDTPGEDRVGRERLAALESLIAAAALDAIDRARESKMVYAGQYDDLRLLQPYAGRLYLRLLLDPPAWFRDDRRVTVVPALRDIFVESPGDDVVARVRDLAEDRAIEPWDLRMALVGALAQWGDRELAVEREKALIAELETGDDEDRVATLRQLTDFEYQLRDYPQAATRYREYTELAHEVGVSLQPLDYYNGACYLSLTGELEPALDELGKCVELMASGNVDPSHMIERRLFERDPELANVRNTERFSQLFRRAFPDDRGK